MPGRVSLSSQHFYLHIYSHLLQIIKRLIRIMGMSISVPQPNSMGINPDDKECEPFYLKMKELDMVSGGERVTVGGREEA